MKKLPFKQLYTEQLAEYGLQNIPTDACFGLQFSAGETVLREGTPLPWLSLIVSGSAKVCRTAPNGKSLILCYNVCSGTLGEIELMLHQKVATCMVVALADFECVAIPYQICASELNTNAVFLNRLGTELAEKLVRSEDNFTMSALCSGEQRLCSYILLTSHSRVFSDILTDVSCSVGLSYRHMFRLLGQLCEEGVLEKRKDGYYIQDEQALRIRAHVTEYGMRSR